MKGQFKVKHLLFKEGKQKIQNMLEVETLIKTMCQVKNLTRILLSKKQRYFMKYLKSNVLTLPNQSSSNGNIKKKYHERTPSNNKLQEDIPKIDSE
jgi:hypothetical protein